MNPLLNPLTSIERTGTTLGTTDEGYVTYDTTLDVIYFWNGSSWQTIGGGSFGRGEWGSITGTLSAQTDLTSYLSSTYTPLNRNITINGITQDLSVDRTWTITGLPSQTGNAGKYLTTDGINASWATVSGGGTLVALPFTTDHITANGNPYVIGDTVWYLGNVYRCIAGNDSLQPDIAPAYWTLLGAGFPLVQQPSDWNSTSGNNQILNKPTIPTGTVTGVTATSPITSSGGTAPVISTSMATDRLIGRTTAGVGVMEEITVGTGLTLSGGTLNATAQVPGFEMNFLLMGA